MEFDLRTLTDLEYKICDDISTKRTDEHIADIKRGDSRASYTNGCAGKLRDRSYQERKEDAFIGTLAELITSKFTKCTWTKESGQYKGNSNPDLKVIFRKKSIRCECRGTRKFDTIIYRPHQDIYRLDSLLVSITNLPRGPICRIGYAFFRTLKELSHNHSEWIKAKDSRTPYYAIPIEYLSDDFSEFGD